MRQMKSMTSWMVLSVLALGFASTAAATDINLGKHIESVKVSGDLRLRQENKLPKSNGQTGRSRMRYRLRVGVDLPLNDKLGVKTRFASGTGEQVSTNQSFDNLSSGNSFWIDRAYLEWKPLGMLKLTGGRMANPFWVPYSADIVWDDDFNPMGYAFNAEKLAGPVNLFLNGMYMVVDEDSGNRQGSDQSETSFQLGGEFKLPMESRLKIAFAQHQWINESTTTSSGNNAGNFGQAATNGGNRRYASGVLSNEFRVNEITAQLSFWVAQIPVAVQGTFIKNADALNPEDHLIAGSGFSTGQKKGDKGSQIGAIIGKASDAKSWEVAYFMKKVETDATVADVSDSDFPGTGRKGSIYWVAYNPTNYSQFKVKYFTTANEDNKLTPSGGSTTSDTKNDLLQVDFSVKF